MKYMLQAECKKGKKERKKKKKRNITIRTITHMPNKKGVDGRIQIPLENLQIHKYKPTKCTQS